MRKFLVTVRCGLDDLPAAIFDEEDSAKEFANDLTVDAAQQLAREVYGRDTSIFFGVDIVEFEDGIAKDSYNVRGFDDVDEEDKEIEEAEAV